MLPLQQAQQERRPRPPASGSPHLVVPQKTDQVMLSFEEYENLMPPEEDLVPYGPDHPTQKEPVVYFNPIHPGSFIKPWPQLAAIHDQNGKIVCHNDAEHKAWRDHLSQYSGGNPDKWREKGELDYVFACETCHFETTNPVAWTDHVRFWKHK